MRVALFGGSFNPPHIAHLLAATYVRHVADVDAVWLLPVFHHPFGKALAPFDDRVALCEAAVRHVDGLAVSAAEAAPGLDGRTLHTVEHLKIRHPEHTFRLVVGADIVDEAPRWHAFDRLAALAPPIVLGRTGYAAPTVPPPGFEGALFLTDVQLPRVSSTDVRARLATGQPVDHLLPRDVLALVTARGLYAKTA
jgi:nicotinate-nucleotide adenylyltransferase